jgi:hypothetical protein
MFTQYCWRVSGTAQRAAETERSEHERTCLHATQQFRIGCVPANPARLRPVRLGAPVDVDKVATLLGIHVSETPDARQSDTVGKITLREGRPAEVWINPLENSYVPRRSFTPAHEIGHFCMHRSTDRHEFIDDKNTMNRIESYWNRYESEANRFAATLLMPKELLETIGRKIIDTYKAEHGVAKMPLARFVNSMAARFGVSSPAMEYRLKSLGVGKRG